MKITKRKLLSKSKLTALTCAVLLGLYGTSVTGAAEAAPVIVSGGGRDVFEVRFLTITDKNKEAAGVLFWDFADPDAKNAKPYNHPLQTQDGIIKGVQYWADILGAKTRNALPARSQGCDTAIWAIRRTAAICATCRTERTLFYPLAKRRNLPKAGASAAMPALCGAVTTETGPAASP